MGKKKTFELCSSLQRIKNTLSFSSSLLARTKRIVVHGPLSLDDKDFH